MGLIPYHNTGKTVKHIGGISINPNETRMVDETQVPKASQPIQDPEPEPEPEAVPNPLADLLACSVPEIVAALPNFGMEELEELEALETNMDKPRKGVLEALDKRRLEIAQELTV